MSFVHARTFDTRWGLGLATIQLDANDNEALNLRVWVPVTDDGDLGQIDLAIKYPAAGTDEGYDVWVPMMRKALVELTAERFEQAFEESGMAHVLDDAIDSQDD